MKTIETLKGNCNSLSLLIIFTILSISCTGQSEEIDCDAEPIKNTIAFDPNATPMLPLLTKPVAYYDSLFTLAMADAKNPEPHEISDKLVRIPGNKNLIYKTICEEEYVLMISWKNHPSYYPDKGKYVTDPRFDLWVTAAPFIQDSCKAYFKRYKDPVEVNMRLRQLLGLQPFSIETFFMEVWVKPEDLYRPCPDNEIFDEHCDLNLPENITSDYRKWFNDTRAVQYTDCNDTEFHQLGYPWTQLGYTYDWSPDNPTHVGLSEFVVKKNATIFIQRKVINKNFCDN